MVATRRAPYSRTRRAASGPLPVDALDDDLSKVCAAREHLFRLAAARLLRLAERARRDRMRRRRLAILSILESHGPLRGKISKRHSRLSMALEAADSELCQ